VHACTPRRLLNISILVIIAFVVLPIYVDLGLRASLDHIEGRGTVGGIDFKAYYLAAHLLQRGEDFYDVRAQEEAMISFGLPLNDSLYIYPPLLAILFLPLTALSVGRAAQVWFLFNLALYGLTLAILVKSMGLDTLKEKIAPLILLAFLFAPVLFTLYKGQINIAILFLLALTYWSYQRGNPARAGVSLACATMIKVVPGLLILYFLWKREYIVVWAAMGTIAILGILCLMIAGPSVHSTFFWSVLPALGAPRPNPSNQSLGGYLSLLLIPNPFTSCILNSPPLWKLLTTLLSLLLILSISILCPRAKREGLDLEVSLVVATIPLVSQIAWVDLYSLFLLPYTVLARHLLQGKGRRIHVVLVVSSFLLLNSPRLVDLWTNYVARYDWLLGNPFSLGLPFYGAIALWLVLAHMCWMKSEGVTTHV